MLSTEHSGGKLFLMWVIQWNLHAEHKKHRSLTETCFKAWSNPCFVDGVEIVCVVEACGDCAVLSGCVVHAYSVWICHSLDTTSSLTSVQVRQTQPSSLFPSQNKVYSQTKLCSLLYLLIYFSFFLLYAWVFKTMKKKSGVWLFILNLYTNEIILWSFSLILSLYDALCSVEHKSVI